MTETHTNQNGLLAYGKPDFFPFFFFFFFFFSLHFKAYGIKFPEEIIADSEKLFIYCIH